MASFLLSEEAERELDQIWLYIARESSSIDAATRTIEKIYRHFWFLASNPYGGRSRDEDIRPGLRSFSGGTYTIIYRIAKDTIGDELVYILHIIHSSRDLHAVIENEA